MIFLFFRGFNMQQRIADVTTGAGCVGAVGLHYVEAVTPYIPLAGIGIALLGLVSSTLFRYSENRRAEQLHTLKIAKMIAKDES